MSIPKHQELYLILSYTDGDDEGLMTFEDESIMKPMMGDIERIKSLLPLAEDICSRIGKKFRICRYLYTGQLKKEDIR